MTNPMTPPEPSTQTNKREMMIGNFFRIFRHNVWTLIPKYSDSDWVKSVWFLCFEFDYFPLGFNRKKMK